LASSEVASGEDGGVLTPSRLTFVEMIKAGTFSLSLYPPFIKGKGNVSYQINY